MAPENRRFVQFPHPGGEHSPDNGDWKKWNPTSKPHGRKFLEIGGAWLETLDPGRANEGKLWAWGEWEPESQVLRRFAPSGNGLPRYLWEPILRPKEDCRELHNTDPLIFDGFHYSNCKQQNFKGLRQLGRGSVIAFGSKMGPNWVVDTVFVVADYVDHTDTDYEERLAGRVPQCFRDAVLSTYGEAGPCGSQRCGEAGPCGSQRCGEAGPCGSQRCGEAGPCGSQRCGEAGPYDSQRWYRWYRGATYDKPVDGMFSFFPCLPAERNTPFARPCIKLGADYFTPSLAQGVKGCAIHAAPLDKSTLMGLWRSIAEQVLGKGLFLGVAATCPTGGGPR